MFGKPLSIQQKMPYLILIATKTLGYPEFFYELRDVPLGTPFEWCSPENAQQVLKSRQLEEPQFEYQLHYVAD